MTELCPYGAPEEIFFRYAFSQSQAKRLIREEFNKAHGYVPWKYVEMEVEVVSPKKVAEVLETRSPALGVVLSLRKPD